MKHRRITELFNFESRGRALNDYTITLTRPGADRGAQAEDFAERLTRWLQMQGDDYKGNARRPAAADGTVALSCTEETMARIERQFAGDILRVDPPATHVRG